VSDESTLVRRGSYTDTKFEALEDDNEGGPWEDVNDKVFEMREDSRRPSQASDIRSHAEEAVSETRTRLLSMLRTQSA
jgi:hypothetical protein